MARFDVYLSNDLDTWLLDVQTDLLDGLRTSVVVPLLSVKLAPTPADRLNPLFVINDQKVVMMTQLLAAVPSSILVTKVVNLSNFQDEISNALDMVFIGF